MDCNLDGFVRISLPSSGNWRLGGSEAVMTETRRELPKPGAGFHETGRLVSNVSEAEVGWADPWPRQSGQAKATLSDLGPGDTTTVIPHRRIGKRQPESSGVSIPSSSPPQIARTGDTGNNRESHSDWRIYTDGGCRVNPGGLGGWAAIVIPPYSETPLFRLSGADPRTTNNRMEMMALINGLCRLATGSAVTLFTDSKYLIWAVEDWPSASGKSQRKAKNQDLLAKISSECDRMGAVRCVWVKGHSGDKYNEECDELVNREMDLWDSRFAGGYP